MAEQNQLTRVEAYSDGVFAIAATLLILEIKVPPVTAHGSIGELWHQLAGLWPSYLAFVLSFGTILVIWLNHYHALRMLKKTSNAFLYANGLLLLMVTFIPFPTALLAEYIETDQAAVAVVFYAGCSLATNLAFLTWFMAMQKPVYLFKPEVGKAQIRMVLRNNSIGALGYFMAAIIAWWFPVAGLSLLTALFVLWILMSVEDRATP